MSAFAHRASMRAHGALASAMVIVSSLAVAQTTQPAPSASPAVPKNSLPKKTGAPQQLSTYMREVGLTYIETLDRIFDLPPESRAIGLEEFKSLVTLGGHVYLRLTRTADRDFFECLKRAVLVGNIVKIGQGFVLDFIAQGHSLNHPLIQEAEKKNEFPTTYYVYCKNGLEEIIKAGKYSDSKALLGFCPVDKKTMASLGIE